MKRTGESVTNDTLIPVGEWELLQTDSGSFPFPDSGIRSNGCSNF